MTARRVLLAAAMAAAAGTTALVIVVAGTWLAGRAAQEPPAVVTQLDQFGDRVAVVRVEGAGASAAADDARSDALRWSLAALTVALVPIAAAAWWLSGRMAARPAEHAEQAAPVDAVGLRQREDERRQLQEIVHELRTPLAVATTNLELATTGPDLDREVGSHLAAARRGLERMARTVDDLAAHGRLAVAGDATVDVAREARALAAEHRGVALAHQLVLEVEGPERLAVVADQAALHTALGNLLSNALRLAPAGSIVRLVAGEWDEWVWVAVRDEGPGLAPADHERAFERYWRGRYDRDRDDDDRSDGSGRGIGLTICRQVTEAQGGHVTVRSAVGVGSTFVVWLPRSTDARTDQVVAPDGVHHAVDPLPGRPVGLAAGGVTTA